MSAGTAACAPMPEPMPDPAVQHAPEPLVVSWQHPGGMWGLSFVNFFLRVLTLGTYNFWGKAELRARLWSGLRLNGEPVAYIGSGWELFIGFMVAMLYIVVPYGTLVGTQLTMGSKSAVAGFTAIAFFVVISWMWAVAFYRARRYRLTRTSWRGIRGNLVGSANAYAWTYLWTMLAVGVTAGWAHPWRQTKLQRLLVENTRLGNIPLTFSATSGRLYLPFSLMWLAGVAVFGGFSWAFVLIFKSFKEHHSQQLPPAEAQHVGFIIIASTLGYLLFWLIGTWYQVRSFNHYSAHTELRGARFAGSASAGGLMWVGLTNTLLAISPPVVLGFIAIGVAQASGFAIPKNELPGMPAGTPATWWVQIVVLLALFSLSLFAPVIAARSARFWVRNLKVEGRVALDTVRPAPGSSSKLGEGLAQAFDIDVL